MEQKKKKSKLMIIIFIAIVVIVVGIIAVIVNSKGNNINGIIGKEPTKCYHIGDTVSTDIVEFTLNDSQLAIALDNVYRTNKVVNENYLKPKEYNAEEDSQMPSAFVTNLGETYVYMEFTVEAIERSNVMIGSITNSEKYVTIQYNNNKYSAEPTLGLAKKLKGSGNSFINVWQKPSLSYISESRGEKEQFRAYTTIKETIENLKDKYYITFKLPNSQGKTQNFTYVINE